MTFNCLNSHSLESQNALHHATYRDRNASRKKYLETNYIKNQINLLRPTNSIVQEKLDCKKKDYHILRMIQEKDTGSPISEIFNWLLAPGKDLKLQKEIGSTDTKIIILPNIFGSMLNFQSLLQWQTLQDIKFTCKRTTEVWNWGNGQTQVFRSGLVHRYLELCTKREFVR